jgi:dipeptide transport system permease protein
MIAFILKRLWLLLPSVLGITLLTFSLIHMIPGDPIEVMVGERTLDPVMHAAALHRLGLDQPLYQQYFDYLARLAHGDLGQSLVTHDNVWSEFRTLFPATLELAVCAMLFAVGVGLLAGVIAAIRRGSLFDHGVMGLALTGFSMPIFWLGLLLIMLFSVKLGC